MLLWSTDIVKVKSLGSIIGRRTTTCFCHRSNKLWCLNVSHVKSHPLPPLLYSIDLLRSLMYLVPCTFHYQLARICGKSILGTLNAWFCLLNPLVQIPDTVNLISQRFPSLFDHDYIIIDTYTKGSLADLVRGTQRHSSGSGFDSPWERIFQVEIKKSPRMPHVQSTCMVRPNSQGDGPRVRVGAGVRGFFRPV